MVSKRRLLAAIGILHFLKLPIGIYSQQPLYPTCYACGCPTCAVGNYEGRIPIPEELRNQVGGFSQISCFQITQAGLAGLIPPDICNLNKSRELQQACQCPPLPPTLAPTSGPTGTRTIQPTLTPTFAPSTIAFDESPSAMPQNNTSAPSLMSQIPSSIQLTSPSPSIDMDKAQPQSKVPSMEPNETRSPQEVTAIPISVPASAASVPPHGKHTKSGKMSDKASESAKSIKREDAKSASHKESKSKESKKKNSKGKDSMKEKKMSENSFKFGGEDSDHDKSRPAKGNRQKRTQKSKSNDKENKLVKQRRLR